MRKMGKPLIAGGRRGKGKSCEFVLHVDLSDTDKGCTMKCAVLPSPECSHAHTHTHEPCRERTSCLGSPLCMPATPQPGLR